jgi:hypothetical protein
MKQQIENGEFRWKDLLTPSQRNLFLKTGFKIGKTVEDNARLAHFIDRLRKGDTAEAAAMSVKKYLFDYGDLTNIERNVLNRVFFFYSWTRKNLPLQLHSLVTTPWKFGIPYKFKHELEKQTPAAPEKYLAEYMKENYPLRVKQNKDGTYEYFMLNNWLPAADLLKVVHIHDIAAQSLAPLPKELIQQLWNYDFYFKRKIDIDTNTENMSGFDKVFGKSKTQMFRYNIPSKLAHGMKAIRLLNEIDKMTKQDAEVLDKMLGLFANTQTFDPKQARIQNARRVQTDIKELTAQLYKEGNKKPMDKVEIQKIRAMIKEKAKEF